MDSYSAIPYILVSVVLGAIGQLMLKYGMSKVGVLSLSLDKILPALTNPGVIYVMIGLMIYVCGTASWLIALSRADLSFAYPFASLSYVAMLIGAWVLFKEQLDVWRLAGSAVIILGVLLISRSGQ
ncbi:MAG: EamA family transporter [Anaerolineales bacterium]|nr:EamA family transporter [Anaerolineales bacterium]